MIPPIALERPDGPDGAPLLLLGPSLGTSTLVWMRAIPLLKERFRVAAWDLPGHGLARPATAAFTVEEIADAVHEAVVARGESTAHVAGVSLGGAVSIALALRHPATVATLVPICSGARIGETAAWQERAAAVRTTGTAALVVPSAQRWFAPGSIERDPDVAGRLLHALRDADDASYAFCCEALAAFDARDALPGVQAPALALWGEHDPVVGEADAVVIADGVPDGRSAMVAGAGHLASAEQPSDVAGRLIRFLEEAA